MRIAVISSYPPIECGIATYSENLCKALPSEQDEIVVISPHGARGDNVFPIYNSADDNIAAEIFHMLGQLTPDIVHIQHEFGLYGELHGIQINELILRLQMAGLPVVTTLHTVRAAMPRNDRIILKNIVQDSAVVIVHEVLQKKILEDTFGKTGTIRVIPHGIRNLKPIENARSLLGVEGRKTAILVGYYRPTKRFERVVDLWPRVVERCPDALLILAGKMRNISFSDYLCMLMKKVEDSSVRDNILVLNGQFPQYTFDTMISAADCMLLPYEAGAQSGILSNSAAFGVPVVTSDLESFDQWNKESGGGLTAHSDDEFVDHICRMLQEEDLRREMSSNIRRFIKPMLWEAVADQHHQIYEEVSRKPITDSRYFYVPEPGK
ncbi:MAG: glycosyltransferase [Spirochaetales bacterium]|nr:glycosyltransferase [Spirochaetales bacterium]